MMGKVIGSCGHELGPDDGQHGLGWSVHTKDGQEEHYSRVCSACKKKYREWGILIEQHSTEHG